MADKRTFKKYMVMLTRIMCDAPTLPVEILKIHKIGTMASIPMMMREKAAFKKENILVSA
jgi:hypothetical protein